MYLEFVIFLDKKLGHSVTPRIMLIFPPGSPCWNCWWISIPKDAQHWAPGDSFDPPFCSSPNRSSFLSMGVECASDVGFQVGNWATYSGDKTFRGDKSFSLPVVEGIAFFWYSTMRLHLAPLLPPSPLQYEQTDLELWEGEGGCAFLFGSF